MSDDDDTIDRAREAAKQRCAASNSHLEARLRNIAEHFRVKTLHTATGLERGAANGAEIYSNSDPRKAPTEGSGRSAMRPAPPPHMRPSAALARVS